MNKLFSLFFVFFPVCSLSAQVFQVDQNFGQQGVYTIPSDSAGHIARLIEGPDQKIYFSGTITAFDQMDLLYGRLLPNGQPDNTFGVGGHLSSYISSGDEMLTGIVPLSNGRVIVGGYSYSSQNSEYYPVILKVLNNGVMPDEDYGVAMGQAVLPLLSTHSYEISHIISAGGGRVYVLGNYFDNNTNESDVLIGRLKANGEMDSTFGTDGFVLLNVPVISGQTPSERASQVIADANGNLYIGGTTFNTINYNAGFFIVKLDSAGTPVNSYGNNGMAIVDMEAAGIDASFNEMKMQTDGKIVCVGYGSTSIAPSAYILARLNTNGTQDNSFGGDGICDFTLQVQFFQGTVVQPYPNGQILVGGVSLFNGVVQTIFHLLNADGSIDGNFGNGGISVHQVGPQGYLPYTSIMQGNDLLTGGAYMNQFSLNGSYFQPALVRFTFGGPVGMNEVSTSVAELHTFPVPATEIVHMRLENGAFDNATLHLYSMEGRHVYTQSFVNGPQVDIVKGFLASGTYQCMVIQDGQTVARAKIMFH